MMAPPRAEPAPADAVAVNPSAGTPGGETSSSPIRSSISMIDLALRRAPAGFSLNPLDQTVMFEAAT